MPSQGGSSALRRSGSSALDAGGGRAHGASRHAGGSPRADDGGRPLHGRQAGLLAEHRAAGRGLAL
eukprot:12273959-Alexandrium_andersonii.AAC.1